LLPQCRTLEHASGRLQPPDFRLEREAQLRGLVIRQTLTLGGKSICVYDFMLGIVHKMPAGKENGPWRNRSS
jgi:hypothetical protein